MFSSSKKRKSSSSSSSSQQQRLFSTLASIEQTDERATQKRKQSHKSSLTQSKAANDQVKLNGILLELRILMQRCLDIAGDDVDDVVLSSNNDDGDGKKEVQVEVDGLLENLLIARRELLGHEMKNEVGDDNEDDDDSDNSDDDDGDVDYAELIQQESGSKKDENSNSSEEEEDDDDEDDDNNNNNLSTQLQNEYESLRTSWKTILNKHHSNLALHSGMSVNSSKFQSKAVDLSFWDQVKFATSQGGGGSSAVDAAAKTKKKEFDDSKLYQQMLKDFISQSNSGGGGGGSGAGGKRVDPAQEAAERLKRAMRKKNGVEGDVDLTTLLLTQEGGSSNLPNSSTTNGAAAAAAKKANVDRRASKGRKIRYTVHPKLVNFTFPVARPEPMIKEDIWFKSLFGGVGRA